MMSPSSLEDRIRELCALAVAAKTEDDLNVILPQLQALIQEHIQYMRLVAAELIPRAFGNDSKAAD